MIRALPERPRPTPWTAILAAAALALLVPASILLAGMAIEGRAAAARPLTGTVAACPAASTESRP